MVLQSGRNWKLYHQLTFTHDSSWQSQSFSSSGRSISHSRRRRHIWINGCHTAHSPCLLFGRPIIISCVSTHLVKYLRIFTKLCKIVDRNATSWCSLTSNRCQPMYVPYYPATTQPGPDQMRLHCKKERSNTRRLAFMVIVLLPSVRGIVPLPGYQKILGVGPYLFCTHG